VKDKAFKRSLKKEGLFLVDNIPQPSVLSKLTCCRNQIFFQSFILEIIKFMSAKMWKALF